MIYLLQSLTFEKLVAGSSRDGLALMDYHIHKYLDEFRSDQLTVNNKSPHKMMYDCVRIFGLRIASQLNEALIKLHHNKSDSTLIQSLRSEVIRKVISLCYNSMLLKQNDKHLVANCNHLAYSTTQFGALIEEMGLKSDFEYAGAYLHALKSQVYPGTPIMISNFSIEKDYTISLNDELKNRIGEHQA